MIKDLTQEDVKKHLHYDPDSGIFTWTKVSGKRRKGPVGTLRKANFSLMVNLYGEAMALHRLAFIYMTGSAPKYVLHKNGNNVDNRWENLVGSEDSYKIW